MSLTDGGIIELSKRMNIPLGGIYFKNEIKDFDFNKSYFINMQDSIDEKGQLNPGSHWVFFQVNKDNNDKYQPIYFDSYGHAPPEDIKKLIQKKIKMSLPYTKKDIQSLMNNACGFYCLALAHYINASIYRSGNIYFDVDAFLSLFEDLNTSVDFKKNEYILLHFFRSENKELRTDIDNIKDVNVIVKENTVETSKDKIDVFKN